MNLLAWLYWNPERVLFTIPLIDRPVVWYGFWFVLGFVVGYFLLISIFLRVLKDTQPLVASRQLAQTLVDKLTWFIVGGTLIGARLGHVFFYEWPRYKNYPLEILKIWEGGLASHGGTIGVIIGVFLYQRWIVKKFPEFTFIRLVDYLAIPAAFAVSCIRIGNFWNQEILGTPSSMPWAIVFGDPMDGSFPIPRHPVQLYEAFAYLLVFVYLCILWKKQGTQLSSGKLGGLLFTLIFTARFFLEFFKSPLSYTMDESFLQVGQLLSIPFIIFGLILYWNSVRHERTFRNKSKET